MDVCRSISFGADFFFVITESILQAFSLSDVLRLPFTCSVYFAEDVITTCLFERRPDWVNVVFIFTPR